MENESKWLNFRMRQQSLYEYKFRYNFSLAKPYSHLALKVNKCSMTRIKFSRRKMITTVNKMVLSTTNVPQSGTQALVKLIIVPGNTRPRQNHFSDSLGTPEMIFWRWAIYQARENGMRWTALNHHQLPSLTSQVHSSPDSCEGILVLFRYLHRLVRLALSHSWLRVASASLICSLPSPR